MSAYSKESEKFENEREALTKESNNGRLKPVDSSVFKKSKEEKELLKQLKKQKK